MADSEAPFLIGGKAVTLPRHFIEDVRAVDLKEQIRTLRRALLVTHSPTANTVGIANASDIFRTARHPRGFVSLEGADHLMNRTRPSQTSRPASSAPGPTCTSPDGHTDPSAVKCAALPLKISCYLGYSYKVGLAHPRAATHVRRRDEKERTCE
jgi:hypothetical protein